MTIRERLVATALMLLAVEPTGAAASQQSSSPSGNFRPVREVRHQGVVATVAHVRATQSDLAAYQLVNRETAAVIRVYYEPDLRQLAADQLPYLAWMVDQVATRAGADAGQVIWHSVVFTTNPDYLPPRSGNDTRWAVVARADGQLSQGSQNMLFGVIPHEQVHAVQNSMHRNLPRWFAEGQASRIGLQISGLVRPEYAASERRQQSEALQRIAGPLNLAGWGGLRPRREAIYRQVGAEDRARMDRDPGFTPSGSFRFGPGDLVAEEVDQTTRYAASLRLFEDLERQAGTDRMTRWQRAVWADPGPVDTARLLALANEHLGQDIGQRLR